VPEFGFLAFLRNHCDRLFNDSDFVNHDRWIDDQDLIRLTLVERVNDWQQTVNKAIGFSALQRCSSIESEVILFGKSFLILKCQT
jgi:hypothetical protein